jgi:uncharacterized protein DUF1259
MNHHPTIRTRYARTAFPDLLIRRLSWFITLLLTTFAFVFLISVAAQDKPGPTRAGSQAAAMDWKAVEVALGKTGAMQPGDVYKFSFPRTDLEITIGSIKLRPALALGSWIAFKKMGNTTMVMGDLVLTEDEVTKTLTKLQEGGIEQTALHNHLLHESPRVIYMHISAMGDAVKIAKAIHDALVLTDTPFNTPTITLNSDLAIDTKQLDKIMGASGKINSLVYQFSIPRAEKIREAGMDVPSAMGVATAINFQPTGGNNAAISGDFVLIASEVNRVIKALRDNGIEVTALHSHMLNETPRLFFMHFWANDDAQKLARGLRAALDKMNIAKPM